MSFFTEKQKDKLIGGLIIIFLGFIAWVCNTVKNKYDNKKPEISKSIGVINKVSDSAKQDNQTINLKIDTAGKVNNDFSRDKQTTTNNNYYLPNKASKNKKDTTIVNNGFLNQGGDKNTYNQTINQGKQQRYFDENLERQVITIIPKTYQIKIFSAFGDAESDILAIDVEAHLKKLGYDAVYTGKAFFPTQQYGSIDYNKNDSLKIVEVNVYSAKP